MEKGTACCRAVAVYSLHTMTSLCPDELECDKNAAPGRAAGKEGDNISLIYSVSSNKNYNNCANKYGNTHLQANTWKTKEKTLPKAMTSLPLTSLAWRGDGQWAQLASKTWFLCSSRVSQRCTQALQATIPQFPSKRNRAAFQTTYTIYLISDVWTLTNQAVTSGGERDTQLSLSPQFSRKCRKNNLSLRTSEVHKSHRLKRPIGIRCIHNHPVGFIACQHLNLNQEGDQLRARGQPPF